MRILVTVKAGTSVTKVTQTEEGTYQVWLKEPPIQGKANQALIKALAEYFNTSQSCIEIRSGFTARTKSVEVTRPS